MKLPPRSPNLNSYAERFVRTIKESCLERMILFGEDALRTAVREFVAHYHGERNHQGIGNLLIFPDPSLTDRDADRSDAEAASAECSTTMTGRLDNSSHSSFLDITGRPSMVFCQISGLGAC